MNPSMALSNATLNTCSEVIPFAPVFFFPLVRACWISSCQGRIVAEKTDDLHEELCSVVFRETW